MTGEDAPPKKGRWQRRPITPDMSVEKIDEAKIARALAFVKAERAKAGKNKLAEALSIGDYLYTEFFHRDPQSYTDKGRNSPSLRALMQKPEFAELGFGRSTIANYITVAIQRDRFEHRISKGMLTASVRTLPLTQRYHVARCRRPSDEARIAAVAVEEDLRPDDVAALVQKANAGKQGGKPAPTRPDSEAVAAVKFLYKKAHSLLGIDLTSLGDDDFQWLETLSSGTAKVLEWFGDEVKGELAARPGATSPPTPMDMSAVSTPHELDALLTDLVGENLGAGDVIRTDAGKVINYHARHIVAHIKLADRDFAQRWLLDFVATVAADLPVAELLGFKLRVAAGQTQARPTGSARAKPRRTWYAIQSHAKIPDGFDTETFLSGAYSPRVFTRCIVQAFDPQDAVHLFVQQAAGLNRDLEESDQVVEAKPLSRLLPKKATIASYIRLPRSERWPTLAEYIKQPG